MDREYKGFDSKILSLLTRFFPESFLDSLNIVAL